MNSFSTRSVLRVGSEEYEIHRLEALDKQGIRTNHLPYSLRLLLENLLRNEDGHAVKPEDVRALAAWDGSAQPAREIAFTPTTCGISMETGWFSMAASASMPPTPQPSTPRPLIMVVCESVPTRVSG